MLLLLLLCFCFVILIVTVSLLSVIRYWPLFVCLLLSEDVTCHHCYYLVQSNTNQSSVRLVYGNVNVCLRLWTVDYLSYVSYLRV